MLPRIRSALPLAITLVLCARAAWAQADATRPLLCATRYELNLSLDFQEGSLAATSRIELLNSTKAPVREASFILYRLLTVRGVKDASGRPVGFTQRVVAFEDDPRMQVDHVIVPLPVALPPGGRTSLEIAYDGYLAGYVETGMLYVQDRVDSAFTIVRPDAQAYPQPGWPSDSLDRAAGLQTYDYVARVTVPATHVVANGGELLQRAVRGDRVTYVYRNLKPAWRMDLAVARFGELQGGGLHVFYLPGDSAGAVRVLDAMRRSLALFTSWFGPLRGAAAFTVIEVPDGWGSQADVSSILQAAAAFRDPSRVTEVYHEIAHLWNPKATEVPDPRWNEGFASLMQELTAQELAGSTSLDAHVQQTADWLGERLRRDSTLHTLALVDFNRAGKSGYTYSVGMLTFYGLYRLAGPEAFRRTFRDYYSRYYASGGTAAQLAESARRASLVDLGPFLRDWLFTPGWARRLTETPSVTVMLAGYTSSAAPGGRN